MNLGVFAKAKELQQRLLFTLFILIIYRIGTFVPVPGMDMAAFQTAFDSGGGRFAHAIKHVCGRRG